MFETLIPSKIDISTKFGHISSTNKNTYLMQTQNENIAVAYIQNGIKVLEFIEVTCIN